MADPTASAKSAWSAVGKKFSETPAKGPCIPCQAKKKKNPVGPKWEKDAKDVFPGQQSYNNCGVQSARQVVEQAKGKVNKTESQFLNDAISSCGVYSDSSNPSLSGTTSPLSRQCVMQQYGVSSTIEHANIANVDAALREGKGVIISADSAKLWSLQGLPAGDGGGHAVLLTNAIYDSTGKMTGVDVNDTGVGMRYAMSTDDLETAMKSGSGWMNVTTNPIWPSN